MTNVKRRAGSVNRYIVFVGAGVSMLWFAASDARAWHRSLRVCNDLEQYCPYASIQAAVDAAGSGDTIRIGPGVFSGSIYPGGKKDLRIIGSGKAHTTIEGGPVPPVSPRDDVDAINCSGGGEFLIRGVTITHTFGIHGPGIHNQDCTIFVERSNIQTNLAAVQGGGIFNAGTLVLKKTDIQDNVSDVGGGVYNSGRLIVEGGHILNNSAQYVPQGGGGIYNSGTAVLWHTEISGNDAVRGGGISNEGGDMSIIKSAVHHNHVHYMVVSNVGLDSGQAGGIWNSGKLKLVRSLIDYNSADLTVSGRQGGGLLTQTPGTTINVGGRTLFYGNAPNDCADETGPVACP